MLSWSKYEKSLREISQSLKQITINKINYCKKSLFFWSFFTI